MYHVQQSQDVGATLLKTRRLLVPAGDFGYCRNDVEVVAVVHTGAPQTLT